MVRYSNSKLIGIHGVFDNTSKTHFTAVMPKLDFNPDLVIVRSVTFNNSSKQSDRIYSIFSNISNRFDYLCSVSDTPGPLIVANIGKTFFHYEPHNIIMLPSELPSELQFTFMLAPAISLTNGALVPDLVSFDLNIWTINNLVIELEFLAY